MAVDFWGIIFNSLENKFAMFIGCTAILSFVVIYCLFFSNYAMYDCWIFHMDGIPFRGKNIFRIVSYYFLFIKKWQLSFMYEGIYAKFNRHKYVRIFRNCKRQVLIRDLRMAKKVLVTDRDYFKDRATDYYNRNKDNCATLVESYLKSTSYLISHAAANIMGIHQIIWICSKKLEDLEMCSLPGAPVDWHDIFNKYLQKVILTVLLGTKTYTEFKLKFLKVSRTARQPLSNFPDHKIFLFVFFQQIDALGSTHVNSSRIANTSIKYFHDLFNTVIREEQVNNYEANEGYVRLMASLINKRNEDVHEETAIKIAYTLFGITAYIYELESTMCECLKELAANTEVQDKLYQALRQLPDVSCQSVGACEYLELVIRETMRKYPPISFLQRECIKNYQFPNDDLGKPSIKLRKGTQVFISIKGIQNDPDLFPEPDKFNPERFSKDNLRTINPLSYMPFGTRWIDSQFGTLVIKTGLAMLLLKYKVFLPENSTPLEMEPRRTILNDSLWLSFQRRANH